MKKDYSKALFNYVSGNDIEDYSLDELEDDYEFMMLVIRFTNDKKMYEMCSDRVKTNYIFVKFIIELFKDDIDFVCKVADKYLEQVPEEEEVNRIELQIIMRDLTKKELSYEYSKYNVLTKSSLLLRKLNKEMILRDIGDDQLLLDELQMGFCLIIDEFSSSEIIMNDYAKDLLEDIISENIDDFRRKFINNVENEHINAMLIEYFTGFDCYLANYLCNHIELLDAVKFEIKKQKNRKFFNDLSIEQKRFEAIVDYVNKYFKDLEEKGELYDESHILLYFIAKELGFVEKLYKYSSLNEEIYDELVFDYMSSEEYIEINKTKHYDVIKEKVIELLNADERDLPVYKDPFTYDGDDDEDESQSQCKIIKLEFPNKKEK